MKNATPQSNPNSETPELSKVPEAEALIAEAWQEFLEDDADCCGGCNHKPR